jgi:uncharacterized membrane protein YkoI
MPNRGRKLIMCLAALGALVVGGSQVAGAATKSKTRRAHSSQTSTATTPGAGKEPVLSGDALDKVTAAVKAELPGSTIDRASTETDGKSTDAYEAHVTKADGSHVEVLLDSSFAVTAVNADKGHGGPGHGRGGGHGHGGGSNEAVLTGDTLDKVTAAVKAELPGSTIDRASVENDGKSTDAYEVHATKADGSHVEVLLDSSFAVTSVK